MTKRKDQLRPKDRRMDAKMTILGFVGFTVLAGVFFVVGLYGVGPMIRSHKSNPPAASAPPRQIEPEPPRRPIAAPESRVESPSIDLEVLERAADSDAPQPNDGDNGEASTGDTTRTEARTPATTTSPPRSEAKSPSNSGRTTTGSREGLERPRAATESQPAPSATSADNRIYRVQAGTFSNRDNADRLASDLRKEGYRVEIRTSESDGRTLHRVQIAGYSNRKDADKLVNDLNSKGFSPAVVEEKRGD